MTQDAVKFMITIAIFTGVVGSLSSCVLVWLR